jgi:hypothetical protein
MLRRASSALFILVVAGLAMSLEAYRFKKTEKTGSADTIKNILVGKEEGVPSVQTK